VAGLPKAWKWQDTNDDNSLAAQAIHSIMLRSEKACIVTRSLIMQPSRSTQILQAATGERNLALIIAVGDYMHLNKLPNAVRDGETLKQTLESLSTGWEVDLFKNPTYDEALDGLSAFVRKCERVGGAVLVALIGHGAEEENKSYGHFFLRDSEWSEECDIDSLRCISTLEVCAKIRWPRSKSKFPPTILVFDCCRTDFRQAPAPPKAVHEFLNLLQIFSTTAGNPASDGMEGQNGPFMGIFHKLIQTPGLELATLLKNLTAQLQDVQLCTAYTNLATDFFFVPDKRPRELLQVRVFQ
jgi:hypothetical protein